MVIDEFLNTKLSGVMFAIAMLIGWAVLWYHAGYSRGYAKGMRANHEKQETTNLGTLSPHGTPCPKCGHIDKVTFFHDLNL